ncbi:MAG: BLUF domain-containing protein [Acetobacteraceae bacterium]|nr:BLUF domain-containing protein [Acetobacteraceae bacterium]
MQEPVFRLTYCSHSALDCAADPTELDRILATSRRNNAAAGVTGALIYNRGIFAQTLEGSFDAVQTVFERIQSDLRHDEIVVLQAEPVEERLFGAWAMAQAEPDHPARVHETLTSAMIDPGVTAAPPLLELLTRVVRHAPA